MKLTPAPDFLLLDAITIEGFRFDRQRPLVHGDALSLSIAAASVVPRSPGTASCWRWTRGNPATVFAQHKGYGTVAHLEAPGAWAPARNIGALLSRPTTDAGRSLRRDARGGDSVVEASTHQRGRNGKPGRGLPAAPGLPRRGAQLPDPSGGESTSSWLAVPSSPSWRSRAAGAPRRGTLGGHLALQGPTGLTRPRPCTSRRTPRVLDLSFRRGDRGPERGWWGGFEGPPSGGRF
jgi:hypothetical protein